LYKLAGPLSGVKVIDFSAFAAAPSAARILARFGADVIHVEGIEGDEFRVFAPHVELPIDEDYLPLFELVNADKRGISVNLKNEEGNKLFHRLLEKADVMVTSIRPKALNKLGLSYEQISQKYPKIVYAHIDGYGNKGPLAGKKGFDYSSYISRTGMGVSLSEPDAPPMATRIGLGDMPTGGMLAFGIVSALYNREKTGKGDKIEVSLYHAGLWSMGCELAGSVDHDRTKTSVYRPNSLLGTPWQCKDGKWITLVIASYEKFWPVIAKLIGREDLMYDEKICTMVEGQKHITEYYPIVRDGFLSKDRSEWDRLLTENDVSYEDVQTFYEANHDEQALVNNFLQEISYPNGKKGVLATPPIRFASMPEELVWHNSPYVGEHTREVMLELGYSEVEIEYLISKNVVKDSVTKLKRPE
jgi:crotonobetainyl-CoA:carnitine CoA-transferase CaiB-like acyl-CoA transferase